MKTIRSEDAPSARRIPSSWVRSVTTNATTAYVPENARNTPTTPSNEAAAEKA